MSRHVTAVLCGTMAGNSVPPQLIYQGKTAACLRPCKFPNDWHVTCTPNHWSSEEKVLEYIHKNSIIPYARQEFGLPPEQAALALFDIFIGQQTKDAAALLEENYCGAHSR